MMNRNGNTEGIVILVTSICTTYVSEQERANRGERSQKKWSMTFEPQKFKFEIETTYFIIAEKLTNQEDIISFKQNKLFIIVL